MMHSPNHPSTSRIGRALPLLLALLLAACGAGAPEGKAVPPTATSVTADVPGTTAETPVPEPTMPLATADDIALIKRSILNTSVATVDRLHFVMTSTATSWPTTITEGDYLPLMNIYQKATQGSSVDETLRLDNRVYCKDSSGKWIVVVEDMDARVASSIATAEAQRKEEWEKSGFPGTPPPMPTMYNLDRSQFPGQLPLWGTLSFESYEFGYAGEEIVDGTVTRHYVGRSRGRKLSLPPNAETDTENIDNSNTFNEDTFALWIDPAKEQVRKIENKSVFSMDASVDSATLVATSYSYGCGVPTPAVPPPTPTPFERPTTNTTIMTIVYSKINDPSVVLPTP